MKVVLKTLVLICVSFLGLTKVQAANPYAQNGPYGTNCTWYAWNQAYEKGGVSLPGFSGNAKDWYNSAQNLGFSVGSTPRANSIVVWSDWTDFGHVGYVESVGDNVIYVWDSTGPCIDEDDPEYITCMQNGVSEETDRACRANAKRKACEYSISPSRYTIAGYIYLDEAPKTPSSTPVQTPTQAPEVIPNSSNADLSFIEVNPGTIDFAKDTLKYNLEVASDVDKITIKASAEDTKATVTGDGDRVLAFGLNEFKLVVTAEDGSVKEYLINVTRKEEVKTEDKEETNNLSTPENEKENNAKIVIIVAISASAILVTGIVTYVIIKKKKKSTKEV